jgi:cell division protein FtsQ
VTTRARVSATSADRFAARSRARRWEGLRPLVTLVLLLVLAAVAGWVLYASPWFAVRTVEVSGVRELSRQAVLDAARVDLGTPLVRLDPAEVRERVAALPRVESAEVSRHWPRAVRITVVERRTAAVVRSGRSYLLVDPGGVVFGTVARPPRGVPFILAQPATGQGSLRAAVGVLRALPAAIARRVTAVRAGSPDAIVLDLSGGVAVMWGSAQDSGRKAEVLAALMRQPAKVYDVSAPEAPTTRTRL